MLCVPPCLRGSQLAIRESRGDKNIEKKDASQRSAKRMLCIHGKCSKTFAEPGSWELGAGSTEVSGTLETNREAGQKYIKKGVARSRLLRRLCLNLDGHVSDSI